MPSGLIALLDDVATLTKLAAASVDDVGLAAGKAGTKAAGVVIDDTAVTPRYVVGFAAKRELLDSRDQAAEQAAAKKMEDSRIPNTQLSLPLTAYTGTYGGVMYGDAKVSEESGKLVVRFVPSPLFVGDLEHWHFDTFRVKWRDSIVYPFPRGFVSFIVDNKGKVSEMKIDVVNQDFDFTELEFKRQ